MKLNKKYLPSSEFLFYIIGILMVLINVVIIQIVSCIVGCIICFTLIIFMAFKYAEKYDKWRKNM